MITQSVQHCSNTTGCINEQVLIKWLASVNLSIILNKTSGLVSMVPQMSLLYLIISSVSHSTRMMTSHVLALPQSPCTVVAEREHAQACVNSP